MKIRIGMEYNKRFPLWNIDEGDIIAECLNKSDAQEIVKRVNEYEELEHYNIKHVEDRVELDRMIEELEEQIRELVKNFKTILFQLGGELESVDNIDDIAALKYNQKNAIRVIKKALEKAEGVE